MGISDTEVSRKRKKEDMEENKNQLKDGTNEETLEEEEEEAEMNFQGSEEMEQGISHILEKVDQFNQRVSDLLDSGKSLFSRLAQEFEDRILMMHKEQIEKWQQEIKELRMLDATNEEINARLDNAKCLFQSVHAGQLKDICI